MKTNKTQLSTPVVTLNGVSDTGLRVNWNRIANASGYEVHYSKTSGFSIGSGGVTKVTINSGSTTSQNVTSLTRNTSYYFKVLANG